MLQPEIILIGWYSGGGKPVEVNCVRLSSIPRAWYSGYMLCNILAAPLLWKSYPLPSFSITYSLAPMKIMPLCLLWELNLVPWKIYPFMQGHKNHVHSPPPWKLCDPPKKSYVTCPLKNQPFSPLKIILFPPLMLSCPSPTLYAFFDTHPSNQPWYTLVIRLH